MIYMKRGCSYPGYKEIDKQIQNYFDALPDTISDNSVFFNWVEDTQDLSYLGLQGRLYEQLPEFVIKNTIVDCTFYHTFILYNNETGIHIFSIAGTLDDKSEQFLQEESTIK